MAKLFGSSETMKLVPFLLSALYFFFFTVAVRAVDFNEKSPFVYRQSMEVARTDAGMIRSLRIKSEVHQSFYGGAVDLSFITIEPKSLLLPLFLHRDYVLYVQTGQARLGWVWKNKLLERDLRVGDIYRIPAGCAFYISNTGETERLRLIGIMERAYKAGAHVMQGDESQMAFIGGGYRNPTSVLSGFDQEILRSAFKVSLGEIKELLSRQNSGPIVHSMTSEHKSFTEDLAKRYILSRRNALGAMMGWNKKKMESFNILKKKPSFHNKHGWTKVVDGKDYPPLKHSDLNIFMVNLTKGTMLSPHWNPRATEIGIVTGGRGMVQIVYPNGSCTERIRVSRGDVFVVPQFYPMSQLSFGNESFEFFGFSSCSRGNQPQFLAGGNSVLNKLNKDSVALGFGVSSDYLSDFLAAQRDAVILTCPSCAEELEERMKREEERRKQEEEERRKREEEEEKERRKREEEEERRRKEEEEEEERRKEEEEEGERRKEEEVRREEEEERRKKQEEERREEEEERRKKEEEERRGEEEERRKKEEEEERREEEEGRRKKEEEAERREEEEEERREEEEEEWKKQEEKERRKREEQERKEEEKRKKEEEESERREEEGERRESEEERDRREKEERERERRKEEGGSAEKRGLEAQGMYTFGSQAGFKENTRGFSKLRRTLQG